MRKPSAKAVLTAAVREYQKNRRLFAEYEETRQLCAANPHEDALVASEAEVIRAAVAWLGDDDA